jgi:hypothetical protein
MYQRNRINGFLGAGVVILGLVLAACGSSSSPSTTAKPTRGFDTAAEPPPGPLVFDGTFNGPEGSPPNPAQWTPKIGTPNGCFEDKGRCFAPKELQYYTDNQNAALDGQGDLVITARRQVTPAGRDSNGNVDPKFSCNLSDCQYTSARLSTKNPSGGFCSPRRVLVSRPASSWPKASGPGPPSGCWAQIRSRGPRRARSISPSPKEETLHTPSRRFSMVPPPSNPPAAWKNSAVAITSPQRLPLASNFYSEFHTYTVDQTATTVTFYIDGKQWWQAKSSQFTQAPWIYDQPWYIVLNLAVGDYGGTPPSTGGFPKQMIVNWVKVYKLS